MHFFKQNHNISNIMDVLGGGEKAVDPCLYQELIYIEFWQYENLNASANHYIY